MDLLDIAELHTHWTLLKRPLEILGAWEHPNGLLLESHDDSAKKAAEHIALYLGGKVIRLDRSSLAKDKWHKSVGQYLDGSLAPRALRNLGFERICLIVPELDKQPERLYFKLKGLLEMCKTPFCCIATSRDSKAIPGWLSSHFFKSKKKGRPRRPAAAATPSKKAAPRAKSRRRSS